MRWARRKAHGCAGGENDERNFGYSAAHETDPLPLLPSGPGGVRGESLHRARSPTHRQSARIRAICRLKILTHPLTRASNRYAYAFATTFMWSRFDFPLNLR